MHIWHPRAPATTKLLAVAAVLLVACSREAPAAPPRAADGASAASPAAAATPLPPTHLTIVYATSSSSNALMRFAQDEGILRANGLDVETVYAPGNAGPAALVTGQAQVMTSGCAEAIGSLVSGVDLVYVLVNTNRMSYVLMGGPNVTSRDELRGKRLAVSRIGTSSHLATKFILKQIGLDPDRDATYFQVGNSPERISALLAGSVDASILTVEEAMVVADLPELHVLVDMTQERIPYCGNAMFFQRQWVQDNQETVRRLARATVEATARFKQDKEKAVASVGRFLDDQNQDRIERVWAVRSRMFPAKPYPDPQGFQFVLDEATEGDERARSVDLNRIIDQSFVRELDQSGYIDSLYPGGVAPAN